MTARGRGDRGLAGQASKRRSKAPRCPICGKPTTLVPALLLEALCRY